MSSGASDAPMPTIVRPSAGYLIPSAERDPSCAFNDPSAVVLETMASRSEVRAQEGHHAVPRLGGAGGIVGRAPLVGKGVRGVIAIDFRLVAGTGHCLLEVVDELRRAPVVLVGEVALDRDLYLRRIGQRSRRNAVERHAAGDAADPRRRRYRKRAAHAVAHHADLAADARE